MPAPGLADNPILCGPYDSPDVHWEVGPAGPTGATVPGRRPSESFVAVAAPKKDPQVALALTGERAQRNDLVNEIRRDVERWRQTGRYDDVTPVSRKLLQHWADPDRENRVLFCQREAVETAVYLTEVAGRQGRRDWRRRLADVNAEDNAGLPRLALKMATGSGKTVVMAMLIAWQSANKIASPRDVRFARKFLVVAPGITIRDRLRVLQPGSHGNYYDARDLVPPDLRGSVARAQIVVVNHHTFIAREAVEVRGVSPTTKKLLRPDEATPFLETPDAVASRVLREFGPGRDPVVVINDEAHHCYRDRPIDGAGLLSAEQKTDRDSARVWFTGLHAIARRSGVKQVFDLSATPFYLSGSGYREGLLFPWVVSDFSLMDAIESGIVKIPRVPVDDDARGAQVTYLHLWDEIGTQLPRSRTDADFQPPAALEGALRSLYRSYEKSFQHWRRNLESRGEPPPVYIVVCPNTAVSRRIYEWIAGRGSTGGELPLFSAVDESGVVRPRPPTLLIDSAQLDSGDVLKADFKKDAAAQIAAFAVQYRKSHPGGDVDVVTDEQLLREVLNTVGKRGTLGESIRCVVSVAMLTEGWDANTVTHILGVRAFGSQLLCEQVVGRGLRRRSYALDEDGRFAPEYANVYGIPFSFLPSDGRAVPEPKVPEPAILVGSVPGREHLRITFPQLTGYRIEIPDPPLHFDVGAARSFTVGASTVPDTTTIEGIVGVGEVETFDWATIREQHVAYTLARRLLGSGRFTVYDAAERPWLFPQLVGFVRQWLAERVVVEPGYSVGHLLKTARSQDEAGEAVTDAIVEFGDDRRGRARALWLPDRPSGSTADVRFATRKAAVASEKSEISHVVLDGIAGNTWEQLAAGFCEHDPRVAAFAKNDHLGFTIPYVHQGVTHEYWPDFLVRLRPRDDDVVRTLVVEMSGGRKDPARARAKARTARNLWCAAVNNDGRFGRWGYVEITDPVQITPRLGAAIEALHADDPIVGEPDLLDLERADRAAS